MLDANLNRCGEGLRVVEETLRLVLQDAHLTAVCKSLRHCLGELASEMAQRYRLAAARDTHGDVGRTAQLESEYKRGDVRQILVANFARAGQSLRTLEEYSKLARSPSSRTAEELRFRLYELEKATLVLLDSRDRLATARLCVLIDGRDDDDEFATLVNALIAGGADMLQLRDKSLDDRTLLARARQLVDLTRDSGVIAVVNDRVDVVVAARADGVHLGQDDLSVSAARRVAGPEMLIGVSTHNIGQARQAVLDGADYLGAGPVFPSRTKSIERLAGLNYLAEVAVEIKLPAFAIGGIDANNIDRVLATGFSRVAVSRAASPSEGNCVRKNVARLAELLAG